MKKGMLALLLMIVLAASIWGFSRPNPGDRRSTPTAEPEITQSIVKATGKVVPADYVSLSMKMPGLIHEVFVEENDFVTHRQVLVQLEGSIDREAAVTEAEQEVYAAQQALQGLIDNADYSYAVALKELADAKDELDDAKREWTVNQPGNRFTPQSLKDAKADVIITEERLKQARKRYNNAHGRMNKAKAQTALTEARKAYYQAKWLLEWLQSDPTELELILLDADLAFAEARVRKAEQELEKLKEGPDPEELKLARMRLKNAIAHHKAAQEAVKDLLLEAPFNGTVSRVHVKASEWISVGQPVLQVADLDQLQVETVDLNELDVARIQIGDLVSVTIDALPEIEVVGKVTEIAPRSADGPGVNYPVVIELQEYPEELRWGMTAFMEIDVKP